MVLRSADKSTVALVQRGHGDAPKRKIDDLGNGRISHRVDMLQFSTLPL